MSNQEIKIGVKADAGDAARVVDAVDSSTADLAGSLDQVQKSGAAANKTMADLETTLRRVHRAQEILTREFGRNISTDDATTFLNNFDQMRSGRTVGGRRLRAYNDLDEWYHGHGSSFRDQRAAAQHRRFVMSVGMQGTADSMENGAPPAPGGGPPEEPGASPFKGGVQKAQSMAMGFTKGMLALAGINSLMSMAGNAVDMSTEENVGNADLRRRMGDLGVDFDALRDQVRGATDGLGVTYVEAQRLATQLARVTGNLTGEDLKGRNFQELQRTGIGFARAYGLDPSESGQFMGTMKRLGVIAPDDPSGRRLAIMIAEAVEKGQFSGKADEVLSAIADFATQQARTLYSRPNVAAYAGGLTALTASGYPGLDPAGAASLLSRSDSAFRRGGGVGEASMNFSFMALRRFSPGIDPVSAQGLMSGGMFGTTEGVFGPGSAMGDWYRSKGLKTPGMSGVTNFEKIRQLMRKTYGNSPYYLNALQRYAGLDSPSQAAALDMMAPRDLTESLRMLSKAGIDPAKVGASGLSTIGKIAAAGTPGALGGIYGSIMGRSDIKDEDKRRLAEAFAKASKEGNVDAMKEALVAVVGTKEEVMTEGDETRASITDLKNELTRVGGALLDPLNKVREAVVALAMKFAPEYRREQRAVTDGQTNYESVWQDMNKKRGWGAGLRQKSHDVARKNAERYYADWVKKKGRPPGSDEEWVEALHQPPGVLMDRDSYEYAEFMSFKQGLLGNRRANFVKPFTARQIREQAALVLAPSKYDADFAAAGAKYGIDPRELKMIAVRESSLNPNAVGPRTKYGQAKGLMGIETQTGYSLGLTRDNFMDPKAQIDAAARLYRQKIDAANGNKVQADRLYYAGSQRMIGPNSVQYADNANAVRAAVGGTPMPSSDPVGRLTDRGQRVDVHVNDAIIALNDPRGKPVGTINLKPSVKPSPAGVPVKKK